MLLFTVVFGSVTVTSPSVLKIPPPEPEVPVAELLFTKVAPETIKVPPLLNKPPPPLELSFPCASLPVTVEAFTVIVPPA